MQCLGNSLLRDDLMCTLTCAIFLQKFLLTHTGNRLSVSSAEAGLCWDAIAPGGHDALLRWFEAFAEALQQQRFGVSSIISSHPHLKGINLFPSKEPWQVDHSSAVDSTCIANIFDTHT